MKMKWDRIFMSVAIAIPMFSSQPKVEAQVTIPPVYMPDTAKYSNGGIAIELCKRYIYQASIKPNNLTLQQLSSYCQNLHWQYASCIIQVPPEQSLKCMENSSEALPTLLKYFRYIQVNNRYRK
jgi:hypothetical protein